MASINRIISVQANSSEVFNPNPARDVGLLYTARFLTSEDQVKAACVNKQFHAIFDSEKCWIQRCRMLGISLLRGISAKEWVRDLSQVLLTNDVLCGSISEVDPQIVKAALQRICI